MAKLPPFIPPMLARAGSPFDSPDHLFEIKWDGTRALAFIESNSVRLMNRRGIDITHRYPDLAPLSRLQPGTLLDGEIVVLKADGRPDFNALQSREQAQSALRIRTISKALPATFIAFDQLYRNFSDIMPEPLASRREILSQTLATHSDPRIVASQGVTGSGCAYFENILALELEGMMAKRLSSPYRPGQRTDDWQKIKRQRTLLCAVIGYIPSPDRARDFRSLLIAAEIDGQLVSVGKVGSGFDEASHARTLAYLLANERHSPIIPCPDKGRWVQPGLYCTVAYFERTRTGQLRAPVFKGFHPA